MSCELSNFRSRALGLRLFLTMGLGVAVGVCSAKASERAHGLSIFGPETLKYAPGEPFEYLDPNAPIAGHLKIPGGNFTKLSPFGLTGSVPGLYYKVFDTLGIKSWDDDEPFAVYGYLAESFELADDKLSMTVYLRPEARFSDGAPLTADDVVFSYNLLFDPDVNPGGRLSYKNVRTVERVDTHTVRFLFKQYTRDLPITVTYLTVYPKHIYGAPGKRLGKDFDNVLPIGSGPYEIESYTLGERIVFRRREDYWGQHLPYCKGYFNWKRIEFQVYYDQFSTMEGLKSGYIDYLAAWNPGTFRKIKGSFVDNNYIVKSTFPLTRPSAMKGLAFNLREPRFQDRRIRKIIASLYDFDFINDNYYYGSQDRLTSYFLRQPQLRARPGPAEGRVREILLGLAAKHNRPEEGTIYVPEEALEVGPYDPGLAPDGTPLPIELRIQSANRQLDRMGWIWDPGIEARRKGEVTLDFEINDSVDDGLYHFTQILGMAGIRARAAKLSPLEAQGRYKNFRFDVTHVWYDGRNAPGREMARNLLSKEADIQGSSNLMGLKNPAIDDVLNTLMSLDDYEEVGIYARVFDRIMMANWYVIPKIWPRSDFGAYWNFMGQPKVYASGLWYYYNVLWFWWEDPIKRQQLDAAMDNGTPLPPGH
ncbi:MAG: hypothetical protein ISS31_02860 [Kiritimatiellae bacterium]|nr:hypothetical protein [Kiritimatiellia bacterium]